MKKAKLRSLRGGNAGLNERPVKNGELAQSSDYFKGLCKLAGVDPTARQASKYRLGKGAVYEAEQKLKRKAG